MLIRKLSYQGCGTVENRDLIASFKQGNFNFFLLIDGATDSPDSGKFARQIGNALQKYASGLDTDYLSLSQVNDSLLQELKRIQKNLQKEHIRDYASLLLVSQHGNSMQANNWGDCLLGRINGDTTIDWLTVPHTAANKTDPEKLIEEIVLDEQRHSLTRSFKARRYEQPDIYMIGINAGEKIILASDGFWACATEADQQDLLNQPYKKIEPVEDDMSFIIFKP